MSQRKITRDLWIINDTLIFTLTLILINDGENKLASSSALSSIVDVRDLNVILHSIVLCLIWLRFFQVLLTTYNYGPMLMIIYQMGSEMIKFLLVFFSVIFITSIVMSLLFNNQTTSGKFDEFGTGISKMFSLSLGTFDLADYSKYNAFGAFTEGFLVIILNVLMLNILIAALSVTYKKERLIQTSKFRSVLIQNYNKLRWDEKYGVLILLPAPLSFLSLFILPTFIFSRDPERITGLFARCIFVLYLIPFFVVFATISLFFAFFLYFTSLNSFATGGVKKLKPKEILLIKSHEDDSDEEVDPLFIQSHAFSYRRAVVWVLIGWAFTLCTYFKDCLNFWEIAFRKSVVSLTAQDEMIDSKFVKNIYLTIKKHQTFMIKFDDFLETFFDFDFKELSPLVRTNHQLLIERKKLIERFFESFLYSKKSRLLKREFLKAFVDKRNDYSDEFISRLKFVRVHLILKALKKYKKNAKEISIKNIKVPKHITNFGSFQVKETLVSAKDMMIQQRNTIKSFKQLNGFDQKLK